jgi:hypothetical protein
MTMSSKELLEVQCPHCEKIFSYWIVTYIDPTLRDYLEHYAHCTPIDPNIDTNFFEKPEDE